MFHGSIVALVTPMFVDGVIDFDSLTQLVDFHIENGTDGIVVVGTTGESATLSADEQRLVIKHVVNHVNNRLPVIAGTGVTSTKASIELTKQAMELGVDGCLLMAPAYVKPTQEGLFQHYKAIAQAVPVPLILYNVPGRTACDILPKTVERLSHVSNIVGIKEASGSIQRAKQLLQQCEGRLDVYSGEDSLAKDSMLAGGRGVISVTANAAPKLMKQMCDAALAGDVALANKLDAKLADLHEQLFSESNPIPVKWAVSQLGLMPEGIRLPLTPLSDDKKALLQTAMQQAELLGVTNS